MNITPIFQSHFHTEPKILVKAPGRVNLLGEHVDYNQGPVLPAAIDRAVYLAASPFSEEDTESQIVHLYAIDLDKTASFRLDQLIQKVDLQGKPLPQWAYYPAGVAHVLQQGGYKVTGGQVAYASDIPMGAGLSSSAAVQVAFAVLWQALSGWSLGRLELAQLCQKAENEFVGVSSGLMDQFASACGVEAHALYFDTRSLLWEPAPLPTDTLLVIADSGVQRSLTDSAYNNRRAACEEAVRLLQEKMPQIQSLRDVKSTEFAAFSVYLPDLIRRRAEHVVKEIQRVDSAYQALLRQDKQAMGALMYAGHRSLRDLYEVSTPELDMLVDFARDLPGVIGARLTGAGFGGCTINLVESQHAEHFMEKLARRYFHGTGREAKIFQTQASQGASYKNI
jgi:galactokinase